VPGAWLRMSDLRVVAARALKLLTLTLRTGTLASHTEKTAETGPVSAVVFEFKWGQDYWSSASSSASPTKRIFPNVPATLLCGPAVKNSSLLRPLALGVALEAPPPKSIAQS
jgi:hypothetical protein